MLVTTHNACNAQIEHQLYLPGRFSLRLLNRFDDLKRQSRSPVSGLEFGVLKSLLRSLIAEVIGRSLEQFRDLMPIAIPQILLIFIKIEQYIFFLRRSFPQSLLNPFDDLKRQSRSPVSELDSGVLKSRLRSLEAVLIGRSLEQFCGSMPIAIPISGS